MNKKNILKFFIIVLFIFIIGITNVKAETVVVPVEYITNNTNLYISNNKGTDILLNSSIENNVNIDIKSINLDINYNFKGNVIYQVELSTPIQYLINVNKVDILSGDNACNFNGLLDTGNGFPKIRFSCPYDTDYVVIGLSNASGNNITSSYNFRWNYNYLSVVNENVVNFDPVLNGQDSINNNINNMGDEIKDTIDDTFNNKCSNLFDYNMQPYVEALGNITYTNNNGVYTFNGTDGNYKFLAYRMNLSAGSYNFGSISSGGSIDGYSAILDRGTDDVIFCYGGNCKFTLENDTNIIFYIFRIGGTIQSFNNFVVKPYISKTSSSWCEYGTNINKIDETNNQLGNLNNSLNNSDSTGATNDASNFFSNFTTDTFGLTSIITAPLSLINNLTSSSCSTLRLPLPYLDNKYLDLPCMETIYTKYFGSFFTIYQTITFGIVAYWVIVRVFNQVKDFKNPDHDEIEVLDL